MKKLLVLSLVLGIASLASAGFSIVVDTDAGTVTANGTADADIYLLLTSDAGVTGGALGAAAPSLSGDVGMSAADFAAAVGMSIDGDGLAYVIASSAGEVYDTGDYLSGAYGTGATVANLYYFSEITGGNGLLDSVVIPEPATMALLGLGALVLRRKK